MLIRDAQYELRHAYFGGFVGQVVSGIIWLVSAALGTWVSVRYGILSLVFGGMLIFPLTQLGLRLMGHKASISKNNPMNQLAMQTAFIVPVLMPVIGAAALYKTNWFYPGFMMVVGAHYLPFMFLYGMKQFGILAGLLIIGGLMIGMYMPGAFVTGGWLTGALLVGFAFFLRTVVMKEK